MHKPAAAPPEPLCLLKSSAFIHWDATNQKTTSVTGRITHQNYLVFWGGGSAQTGSEMMELTLALR